jgi:hypothetical protein
VSDETFVKETDTGFIEKDGQQVPPLRLPPALPALYPPIPIIHCMLNLAYP